MRAIYICIVMLLMPALVSAPMSAKVESPDTVCDVEIPSRVTIVENPEGTTVNIESLEGTLLESLATPYQPESSVSARKSYRRKSDWFGDGSLFGYSNSKGKSSYWESGWMVCASVLRMPWGRVAATVSSGRSRLRCAG